MGSDKVEGYPSEAEAFYKAGKPQQPTIVIIDVPGCCVDCKHWSGLSAALPKGKGMCLQATHTKPNIHFNAPAGLVTTGTFGCNQFKRK